MEISLMKRIANAALKHYNRMVLDHPVIVIVCLMVTITLLAYEARDFKIDASAESLLLENDRDLRYAREINARYGVSDFLVVSFSPKRGDLLDSDNLALLGRLRDELTGLDLVTSVLTILDVPLLESPPISYSEFSGALPTLQTPSVDKALARIELRESYFYRKLIVSPDLKTTALIVNLQGDDSYNALIGERNSLLQKKAQNGLTPHEKAALGEVVRKIGERLDIYRRAQHANILAIRAIMAKYKPQAELFLGGISMIADDMITYIKSDLKMFGIGVFALLVGMLGIIFRKIRWVVLPMLCCFLSVIAMMGVLGAFGWEVTVISSNFISLQLIITLAIAVHLIVRYREFQVHNPDWDRRMLMLNTIRTKFTPCLYAALTTIAGFGSLLLCDIKPVIHFGWMMSAGILVSLFLTFILFPSGIVLLQKPETPADKGTPRLSLTTLAGTLDPPSRHRNSCGHSDPFHLFHRACSRLVVENSFIDYFKQSTEIYQGMKVIDQKLGGTTPSGCHRQVRCGRPGRFGRRRRRSIQGGGSFQNRTSLAANDTDKYWFMDSRMETIEKVHDYLGRPSGNGKGALPGHYSENRPAAQQEPAP